MNKRRQGALWLAAGLMLLTAALAGLAVQARPTPTRAPLAALPQRLGPWTATAGDQRLDQAALALLNPSQHLLRSYARGQDDFCAVFVAFFDSQREGRMIHSPLHCLPGEGWVVSRRGRVRVDGPGGPWTVNHLILTRGLDELSVLYWYQGRGRVEASEYADRARLIWDGLRHGRSDGALARVISLNQPAPAAALARQKAFAARLIPALAAILPAGPDQPIGEGDGL